MRRIDLFDGRVIPAERVAIGRLLGLLSDVVVRVATTPEVLRCLQVEAAEELGVRESIDRRGVNVDACRGEPDVRVAVSTGAVGAKHCRGVRAAAGGGRGVLRERLVLERLGGKALVVAEAVSRGGGRQAAPPECSAPSCRRCADHGRAEDTAPTPGHRRSCQRHRWSQGFMESCTPGRRNPTGHLCCCSKRS
jgi:hypothetical protein